MTLKGEEPARLRAYVLRGSTSWARRLHAPAERFHAARASARTRRKMGRNTGGNPGDVRKSALWGSGNRGGEYRSNALWGKGGRGFVTTVVVRALAVPLAAGAGSGSRHEQRARLRRRRGYVSHASSSRSKVCTRTTLGQRHRADGRRRCRRRRRARPRRRCAKLGKRFGIDQAASRGEIRGQDLEKLGADQGPRSSPGTPRSSSRVPCRRSARQHRDQHGDQHGHGDRERRPRSSGRTSPV